jgi:hypothetical protein
MRRVLGGSDQMLRVPQIGVFLLEVYKAFIEFKNRAENLLKKIYIYNI